MSVLIKPDLSEVIEFTKENEFLFPEMEAERFLSFCVRNDWKIEGKEIKNWNNLLLSWKKKSKYFYEKKKEQLGIAPPESIEEVTDFIKSQRISNFTEMMVKDYFSYFSKSNWKNKDGNTITNWKKHIIYWQKKREDNWSKNKIRDTLSYDDGGYVEKEVRRAFKRSGIVLRGYDED